MKKAILLIALPLLSTPLAGQVLTGTVVDARTDSAIEGVTLALGVDTITEPITVLASGSDGAFSFRLTKPGIYVLRGSRLGYASAWSEPFFVGESDTLRVQFTLSEQAISVRPMRVVVRRPGGRARLENWGFYSRMTDYAGLGRARFYTPEELEASKAYKVSDLLRDVPEIELVRSGRQTFIGLRGNGRRVPVFLDGHHLRLRRDESLDEVIALSAVEAIEIYWRWAPAQYGGGAAIVMWTGPR